jgi:hypothetical protein
VLTETCPCSPRFVEATFRWVNGGKSDDSVAAEGAVGGACSGCEDGRATFSSTSDVALVVTLWGLWNFKKESFGPSFIFGHCFS